MRSLKMWMCVVVVLMVATAAEAGHYRYGGYRGHRGGHVGFGWGRAVYVPAHRIYVAPRPVIYSSSGWYATPMLEDYPAPVVVRSPAVQVPPPQRIQLPAGFIETGRRYHKSGDDAGAVDWIRGTLQDGRRVKLEFNSDGTVHETEFE